MSTEVIHQQQDARSAALQMMPDWIPQAFKFVLVGVLNTLVDAALYLALTRWLGFGGSPGLARAISYSAGVVNSYAWNRTWTFKSSAKIFATLAPFALAGLVGAGISSISMRFALHTLGLSEWIAFGLATAAAFAWNFIINKFIIFRK